MRIIFTEKLTLLALALTLSTAIIVMLLERDREDTLSGTKFKGGNYHRIERENFYDMVVYPKMSYLNCIRKLTILGLSLTIVITIIGVLLKSSTTIIWLSWIMVFTFASHVKKTRLKIGREIEKYEEHQV